MSLRGGQPKADRRSKLNTVLTIGENMRFVTVQEMREIDRKAIADRGVSAITLMENAGEAVFEAGRVIVKDGPVVVLSGYGNNGGDGLVSARFFKEAGYEVRVFMVGHEKPLSPEAGRHKESLIACGVTPQKVGSIFAIDDIESELFSASLIIDAIFGIGIRGVVDYFYQALIHLVNSSDAPVISCDIPSGLDADTGRPSFVAIEAAKTVTFGYPKIGFKADTAKPYLGEVIVADIGLGSED